MRAIRAALHVHSTYSDGEFTLAELREVFLAAGCEVVCMADHADAFTPEKVAAYVAECARLSEGRLRFIPGLEFGCERKMHILGYGVTALVDSLDPQTVIAHIESHDGVCVIAHPKNDHFAWIESFAALPLGIETWNSKYDGRQAPRPATFALLGRLRARRPDMRAFYGLDLHWRKQFRGLLTTVRAPSPARRDVLDALRRGDFVGEKGELRLPSDGVLPPELLSRFAAAHARADRLWRLLKRVKGMSGWLGRNIPAPIKAQLRRIR